jgi:rod shape-determining protein MreC
VGFGSAHRRLRGSTGGAAAMTVKPEEHRIERLVLTARQVTQRVSLLFLLTLAAGLLLLGRAESVLVKDLALTIGNATAPVLGALTQSAGGVRRGLDTLHHYLFVFDENARLRMEVERLHAWEAEAHRLDAENRGLRRLLRVQPEGEVHFVTARAIAEASGPFVRTVLVDAGSDAGVARNQAVLTADGLAGRVVSLGPDAARVLLITDINSRIPVLIERSREHGMLSGDNTGRPILEFLPPKVHPAVGERIVTSGDGGVFPPGLPVGVVSRSDESGVRVQPFVDFDRLDYVQIAQFDLSLRADDMMPGLESLPAPASPPDIAATPRSVGSAPKTGAPGAADPEVKPPAGADATARPAPALPRGARRLPTGWIIQ